MSAEGRDCSDESKQSTLGKGDFTRIAESMRESGEALVRGLGITKGLKVLDLGCGDGTNGITSGKTGAAARGGPVSLLSSTESPVR